MSETADAPRPKSAAEPLWDDWEGSPLRPGPGRVPASPELHLDGFDGPLDLLLDLAERARIDLRKVSVTAMVEQFVAALTDTARHVPIERRADWLVLAARLLALRSQLLFAADPKAQAAAAAEAGRELRRLQDLQFARAAAAWLEARPQLGRDVFVQPRRGPDPRVASYMALMEACLAVLEREETETGTLPARDAVYRPAGVGLFRVAEAITRLRARIAEMTEPRPLTDFVPRVPKETPGRELLARAAVGSTFIAALEIARLGEIRLEQESRTGAINVTSM